MSDINANAWVGSTHRPMGFTEFVVILAAIMVFAPGTCPASARPC